MYSNYYINFSYKPIRTAIKFYLKDIKTLVNKVYIIIIKVSIFTINSN